MELTQILGWIVDGASLLLACAVLIYNFVANKGFHRSDATLTEQINAIKNKVDPVQFAEIIFKAKKDLATGEIVDVEELKEGE